jgi:hypothetical protein
VTSPYPFAAGATLTAADLNSYAGLVFIKSQSIGSGVASVTVSDAFSSDFHSYRIVLDSMDHSSPNVAVRFQFVSSGGANFYGNRLQLNNGTATITNSFTGGGGTAYAEISITANSDQSYSSLDVYAPATTQRKGITGLYYGYGNNGSFGYESPDGVSRTGFHLTLASGTFNSGNIRVYGYNNA